MILSHICLYASVQEKFSGLYLSKGTEITTDSEEVGPELVTVCLVKLNLWDPHLQGPEPNCVFAFLQAFTLQNSTTL